MDREPGALAGQMPQQGAAQLAIPGGVGREEARAAARSHLGEQPALDQRAVQAHQLRHAPSGSQRKRHARAVEIDDQRLDPAAELAEEQVGDVEIRVSPAGVVQRAHRGARGTGGPPAHGSARPRGEQRDAV